MQFNALTSHSNNYICHMIIIFPYIYKHKVNNKYDNNEFLIGKLDLKIII